MQTYRFDRLLSVREQEKAEAQTAYDSAVKDFETIANQLYALLKKKEETLEAQQMKMQQGYPIEAIKHFADFISGLEQTIHQLQYKVQKARSMMAFHEEKLMDKATEVRKYEKMKDKHEEQSKQELERDEANRLSELSALQFFNRENR